MLRLSLALLSAFAISVAGCVYYTVEDTGVLKTSNDCVVFHADHGGVFKLESRGDFLPGDRVKVSGTVDFECSTRCEASACVQNNTIEDSSPDYVACGTLKDGAECLLFLDDDGQLLLLDDNGSFKAGDHVRVTGTLVSDCVTTCNEDQGCVVNNTIGACQ
ncbi:MAG: hypothetical protein KDA32_05405 [Phycisphaerales bacterium]|nr:hypothetical protein [Phycisphaerales bacterium]